MQTGGPEPSLHRNGRGKAVPEGLGQVGARVGDERPEEKALSEPGHGEEEPGTPAAKALEKRKSIYLQTRRE